MTISYHVEIVADSISPAGARITTFQLRFPRFILAEFNTHRALSRNARSSRAVPTERLIEEVLSDPVFPAHFGRNRKGMQATEELGQIEIGFARQAWRLGRDHAVAHAVRLHAIGVHKQIVNRILEPFAWVDVVATATAWDNFFALRCHPAAMPEIQKLAVMMARAYRDGEPYAMPLGWWHLPYVTEGELAGLCELRARSSARDHTIDDEHATVNEATRLLKLSTARCARVSYRTFDGKEPDPEADVKLHDQLASNGHWSPFEHAARACGSPDFRSGNFRGWLQYREILPVNVHERFDFATLGRFDGRDFIVGAENSQHGKPDR